MPLRLYGRRDCHLCEAMAEALRERGLAFDEVDVDGSAELKERYGRIVPVLTDAAGRELCRTRLDEAALRQIP
ncbi:MAG TPA: glutaredoxin family protein [Burkholderiales bacterium]|nr:glutaredoxin family protein [Burkholderiales bacterium]